MNADDMQQPFFCSELSRRAAEKTFGTASTGGTWLLLEYAGAWGPKALEESALSPAIKAFFNQTFRAIPHSRLLFIKRGRVGGATVSFFVVRCREREPFVVKFELESYEQLLEIDIAAVRAGRSLEGGSIVREPLFLVCTHGRRDKCCAKFGMPIYSHLREFAGESVWQSSHVGGDRFAANLVCFPHGLFYAHMTEDAARRVVRQYGERRLVLDKYRGRACYSHHVQAAEFFTRSETGATELDALRFLDSVRRGEKSWRVRFAGMDAEKIYEADVSCRMSEFENYITCHDEAQKNVPQFMLEDFRIVASPPDNPV
ncbi:MAG TPA: sucrase ferredoxin [Pyrinomonadaceae bacterium]|jgi:hypothetical protein